MVSGLASSEEPNEDSWRERATPYSLRDANSSHDIDLAFIRSGYVSKDIVPHPDESRLLRLRPGAPVIDVWHTSIDQDGEPYELTRFVIRGDMTGLVYDVPVE